jgi:hypothetical protein
MGSRKQDAPHTQQINTAVDATVDEDSDAVAAAAGRAFSQPAMPGEPGMAMCTRF